MNKYLFISMCSKRKIFNIHRVSNGWSLGIFLSDITVMFIIQIILDQLSDEDEFFFNFFLHVYTPRVKI